VIEMSLTKRIANWYDKNPGTPVLLFIVGVGGFISLAILDSFVTPTTPKEKEDNSWNSPTLSNLALIPVLVGGVGLLTYMIGTIASESQY
jgi:hypothetical protein